MDLHFTGLPESIIDSLGFRRPNELDVVAYETFWNKYLPVLTRRQLRWQKTGIPKGEKLKRFIRKGIPASLRPQIWMLKCSKVDPTIGGARSVDVDVMEMIKLDLPRTFPDNDRISNDIGQHTLARILFHVAKRFPDIGYCQGFNYISALLYLALNEEMLATKLMIYEIGERRNYYTSQMSGILVDVRVLRDLLRERKKMPIILIRLLETDFEMMVSKWFLCWYLETLPLETVLRIWDCLFHEGDPVLFRIAITLIEDSVPLLVKCMSISDVFQVFSKIGSSSIAGDCHRLLQVAFEKDKDFITMEKLNKERAKYSY